MSGNPKTAILAAFVADSLAFGAHRVCDTGVIAACYGRVNPVPSSPRNGCWCFGADRVELTSAFLDVGFFPFSM